MKKAIVIGGTGMVGIELVKLLLENNDFSEVVSLVRRASAIVHPKLNELLIDFDKPETWKHFITGDVLFSTLGTTMAQAKTKEAQYKVDFTYQFAVAEIASQNGIPVYVLVSSAGADSKSAVFYSSMKGKLDKAVQLLPFKVISILRPGQLDGNRTEHRTGEKIALSVVYALNKLGILQKYRPIQAMDVAKAMITASTKSFSGIYTLNEVHKLSFSRD
ncbi:MAG: NAD(P)H-binding protein [Paludibacter sp.]